MPSKRKKSRIEVTTHDSETRANIPTAELESLVGEDASAPETVKYSRKDRSGMEQEVYERDVDLDPQLVWKGKDQEDREPLSVDAAPIFVQEKIHPKTIIDDIRRRAKNDKLDNKNETPNLFEEWAGDVEPENRIKFYQHDLKWSNRLILGDSLQVMTSLSSKEGLKGRVQCIFLDPPYGIRFNSNWQTSLKGSGGKNEDITREPEAIKAFRDTWKGGVNSYLSYLRDRLIVANDLLSESGAIFLQIGEQNVHRAKALLDEVFGHENCVATIPFVKTTSQTARHLPVVCDYIVFYAKNIEKLKYRKLYKAKEDMTFNGRITDYGQQVKKSDITDGMNVRSYKPDNLTSQSGGSTMNFPFKYRGKTYPRKTRDWSTNEEGMNRLSKANRIHATEGGLQYVRYPDDFEYTGLANVWTDTTTGGFGLDKLYVVQTTEKVVARCINMVTDPGDLILDPTCGSGTTGIVAERFGRRWILIDTSRVAITVARQRLIGAHYPYFAMRDSMTEDQLKSEKFNIRKEIIGDISNGLHVRKAPNITLKSISSNISIDEIDQKYEMDIESKLSKLRDSISKDINIWDLPTLNIPEDDHGSINCFNDLVHLLRSRQAEIDTAIREGAELVPLHDQPIEIKGISRVTGPFTVESLSPHRVLPTNCEDDYIHETYEEVTPPPSVQLDDSKNQSRRSRPRSVECGESRFIEIIYENLAKAGIQNTKAGQRIEFESLDPWPNGRYIQFDGRYMENGSEKKVAVCVGPEYGTITKSLMVRAAREASDIFDVIVFLGFAFEAHADEDVLNLGRLTVLRARMNNDLHMADKLKSGRSGNLFVIFGEPDIKLRHLEDNQIEVEITGIDIYDPTTGEVETCGPEDVACWFIDTDYNDEAFFVRHAYFSGGGSDPFKSLKRALKTEINQEVWAMLHSTVSMPFSKPSTGRIAIKAINHYGDEVLKVFNV